MKKAPLFLACVFLVLAFGCKHGIPSYGNNHQAGKYYKIRGIKLYCEVYGIGKPLLMIHGNNGSINTFQYNIPHFTEDYKVIVVDARGQGKSIYNKDSLTFEMMADDYADLLDSMNIDSTDVLGWSDGGISGLLLAMRHPEKVKKLAISGANLWPDTTAVAAADWRNNIRDYEALKIRNKKTESELRDMRMLHLDLTEPHISLKELRKVKCPALIICGDHDLIKLGHTQLIFENIPQAHLWVIPNSSHYTLMEHRRIFDLRVDDFFSRPFKDANVNVLDYNNY
ncbi:pimeloyl-ACP methyl ester carboxylesterase [Pedobacter sp. UYEF25]